MLFSGGYIRPQIRSQDTLRTEIIGLLHKLETHTMNPLNRMKSGSSSSSQTVSYPEGANLVLVGFMGTGKTTLGRALARKLNYRFVDTDHLIEERNGKSIPQIFEQEGEAAFRQYERQAVEEWVPRSGCVVSCGGGLIMAPGMLDKVKELGVLVCLFASPETILSRVGRNDQRPLLRGEGALERIQKLLEERLPVYLKAGTGVLTDNRSEADILKSILRIYRSVVPGSQDKRSKQGRK